MSNQRSYVFAPDHVSPSGRKMMSFRDESFCASLIPHSASFRFLADQDIRDLSFVPGVGIMSL